MATNSPALPGLVRRPGASPTLRYTLLAFPVFAVLSMIWVFASPLMSVPDEPAHTIKAAAVARGELKGESAGKQGDLTIVTVPRYIAMINAQACFGAKNAVTPACAPPIDATARDLMKAPTSAGNYNPMYYAMVGLPSRVMGGAPAIYIMRSIGALVCSFFLAATFGAAASMRRRFWPVASTLVSVTPMVLFLEGSVNPNALEIVTTSALFMNLCLVFQNYRKLNTVRTSIVLVGISGAVLANTRALSLLWLALAVVAAVLIYGFRPLLATLKNKLGLSMTVLMGLGCAISLVWLVRANSFNSLTGAPSDVTPDQAFVTMLDRTFDYSSGYIGIMGWLDAPAPAAVFAFWHFAFAAIIVGGLTARPVRARPAVWVALLAVVILPPILQAQVIQQIGYIWQGRYLLALFVLLLLASGVAMRLRPTPNGTWARSLSRWLLAGGVGVHLYLFLQVLRRYTVGFQARTNWTEMFDPAWQPPLTWQGLSVAYLLVLAAGAILTHRFLFPREPLAGRKVKRGGVELVAA
ncbi:DUF2142 domain-containing protein [Arthrobacter terricola]|uniref:DUF2142 domain-containing protein n=1 Tax=Arthrobacter terricola TaxID=2547396 RepID=A0A4R5KS57_9MICC|nr:DUF2142 domain-containing protein [Arthrobacter terricola]